MTAPPLTLRPLTPGFGAEVIGLDLSGALAPHVAKELRTAFERHLVLLFRDQRLSPEQHIAFSRNFGELQIHVLDHVEGLAAFEVVEQRLHRNACADEHRRAPENVRVAAHNVA